MSAKLFVVAHIAIELRLVESDRTRNLALARHMTTD